MTLEQLKQLQRNRKAKADPTDETTTWVKVAFPSRLHRAVKGRAGNEGKTVSEAVIEALTTWTERKRCGSSRPPSAARCISRG